MNPPASDSSDPETGATAGVLATVAAITDDGVELADGRRIAGAAVVRATGNPAPKTASGAARVLSDPWAPGALAQAGADDDVVIVGTGLTMVDMLQALEAQGWRGRALALSRRGLMPRTHADLTLQTFAGSVARSAVIIFGMIAVLRRLGVETTSIIAVLGAASLAIGLALQGALSNVAAGVLTLVKWPRPSPGCSATGRRT